MTGYCGHLFCNDCAKALFKNFHQPQKGVYRSPSTKDFEFYAEDRQKFDRVLYYCKLCVSNVYPKGNQFMYMFCPNLMLKNLYRELKNAGYLCDECPTNENLHPKYNSLRYQNSSSNESSSDGGKSGYKCVWHAYDYNQGTLTILDDNSATTALSNPRLASLDRTHRKVIAALYHCACCSNPLPNDLNGDDTRHGHLQCGHFVGARCVKKARVKSPKADYLFCVFCRKSLYINVDYERFVPRSKVLAGIVLKNNIRMLECAEGGDKCGFQSCNALFPVDAQYVHGRAIDLSLTPESIAKWICTWCSVEHRDDNCVKTRKIKKSRIAPSP